MIHIYIYNLNLSLLWFPRMYTPAFAKKAFELFVRAQYQEFSNKEENSDSDSEAMRMFAEASLSDLGEDAGLVEFAHYLRGRTGLCIPTAWRPLLPVRL